MLVLSRRVDESITVGDVVFTLVSVEGGRVRVGITAPKDKLILRNELIKGNSSDESRRV